MWGNTQRLSEVCATNDAVHSFACCRSFSVCGTRTHRATAAEYEALLRIDPSHRGATVNRHSLLAEIESAAAAAHDATEPWLDALNDCLAPILSTARAGGMSAAMARRLASGDAVVEVNEVFPHVARDALARRTRLAYHRDVSWPLFTSEYFDALGETLRAHGRTRVLEVAAGSGVLRDPMQKRGLEWVTTDSEPQDVSTLPDGRPPPIRRDATAALEAYGDAVDLVFWAWWLVNDEGDASIVRACAARGLPCIFVGEGRGGCTGSAALWVGEQATTPRPLVIASDVVQWPGVQDQTWVVGVL